MGLAFDNLTCEELCDLICGKPDDDNVSVMIFSCDAYSDIWKYFLRLYYKYWDCPYETYITAETKQVVGDVSIIITFQHRAGVRLYTWSLDFAQPCVFGKQLPGPILCASLA